MGVLARSRRTRCWPTAGAERRLSTNSRVYGLRVYGFASTHTEKSQPEDLGLQPRIDWRGARGLRVLRFRVSGFSKLGFRVFKGFLFGVFVAFKGFRVCKPLSTGSGLLLSIPCAVAAMELLSSATEARRSKLCRTTP